MNGIPTPTKGTFVSLYSGAGGLDLGFARAGYEAIWANDIDPLSVETHNKLLGKHVGVAGDIRQQKLPRRGAADLVIGGPPCQGFSVAGKMDPNDPRSRHVWDFLGAVDHLRPRAFVMENVKALAVNKRWAELRDALVEQSVRLGYTTTLLLLNASHFGVPQARERMFLIGTRDRTLVVPQPTTADAPLTVRDVLATLPRYGDSGNESLCPAGVTPAKNAVMRKSPYAGMLFNGQGRPLDLDRPAPTLPASMGGNRTPIIDQLQLEDGGTSWIEWYHGHLSDGGSPVTEVPEYLRRLTVEEAAAMQTFPPATYFAGKQTAQYRQIGNAVPPELGFRVALGVAAALDGKAVRFTSTWASEYLREFRRAG